MAQDVVFVAQDCADKYSFQIDVKQYELEFFAKKFEEFMTRNSQLNTLSWRLVFEHTSLTPEKWIMQGEVFVLTLEQIDIIDHWFEANLMSFADAKEEEEKE